MHASSNSTTAPSLQPCSCSPSTKRAPIARGRSILAIACQKIAGANIAKSPQGPPPSKHYISIPPYATLAQHMRIPRLAIHTVRASRHSNIHSRPRLQKTTGNYQQIKGPKVQAAEKPLRSWHVAYKQHKSCIQATEKCHTINRKVACQPPGKSCE